ncbi:MAG: S9 family peptidase [Balneolaceae bacterium]|nr:S9 family peptidase [Balneolaceae bacterium]
MKKTALLIFLALWIACPLVAQQGIQPEDYYKTVFVSQTEISPEGNYVAFTKTTIDEEKNSRHSEVWMQKLSDGRPDGEPFLFTDPTVQSSNPQWSPDGTLLSIQSRRGDDSNSVRFIRVTAPGGEAFTIEGLDRTPVWSPDGSMIAFVREPKTDEERHDRAGWIAPDAITNTLDSTRFDGRVITQMRYKSDGTSAWLPHPSIQEKRQIHLVSAEGGEPAQLTDLPFHASNLEWSHDGSLIYFTGDPEEDDEYNTDFTRNLYVLDIESGEWNQLLEMDGNQTSPVLSPEGRYLAFLSTAERGAETDAMIVSLNRVGYVNGTPQNLTENWSLQPGGLHWTSSGNNLRFNAQTRGNQHLFEVSRSGGDVRQVTEGDRRLGSISVTADGSMMAYTSTDAITPAEALISRADGSREVQFTNFNQEWMAERVLNPAESITWTVEDGTEIQGWVIKPVGYEEGQSYPIVMKIHGGPHTAYGNTWFQAFHTLSASGMFVFYPNPRGSSSYGNEFTYATLGQWGVMDEEDFMTGLEAVMEAYPGVDAERVGVSGGSYGGFMTNWLTARFPDHFRAAVTSRSISNWDSWYGSSDAQGLTEFEFGGTPWEQRDLYRELSPMSYVENVVAPTLIIHSEEDWRTPMTDAEQWYMALKKMQIPVEFVRYPRSSHGLSRTGEPWLLVDRLERKRSWFDYWLNEN